MKLWIEPKDIIQLKDKINKIELSPEKGSQKHKNLTKQYQEALDKFTNKCFSFHDEDNLLYANEDRDKIKKSLNEQYN